MIQKISIVLAMVCAIGQVTFAAGNAAPTTPAAMTAAPGANHPCAQIEADCKKNGYVAGEAGQGKGLWWDCMCPLIASGFPEPSKNVLTVPSDSGLVTACRAHPHGQQIMSRCAGMMAKKNANQAAKAAAKGGTAPTTGH